MIIKQINQSNFIDAFRNSDTYKDNFSYDALVALYDHLQQCSEDMGEPFELDVVAIACDFVEYDSAYEAMEQYQAEDMPTVDGIDDNGEGRDLVEISEETEQLALDWLNDHTTVLKLENGGVIIQNF